MTGDVVARVTAEQLARCGFVVMRKHQGPGAPRIGRCAGVNKIGTWLTFLNGFPI